VVSAKLLALPPTSKQLIPSKSGLGRVEPIITDVGDSRGVTQILVLTKDTIGGVCELLYVRTWLTWR
jgi:hypothetical protein